MAKSLVRQIKILISSTREDLKQYRDEAAKIIDRLAREHERDIQLRNLSMEREAQSGNLELALDASKRWVEEADWVVVILAWHYGTVPEDAHGLSITESEFRHARDKRKKIFVFVAGEPDTADQYRYTTEEAKDLKDWMQKESPEDAEKLRQFKQNLTKCHVAMFCNLQNLRDLLDQTLRDQLRPLPSQVQPGTPLAELIVTLSPKINDCVRNVGTRSKLVATPPPSSAKRSSASSSTWRQTGNPDHSAGPGTGSPSNLRPRALETWAA